MNKIIITLGEVENACFVAMPFSPLFQIEYEKIILPALTELNVQCVRGDEIYSKQRIVDDIWNSIKKSRFLLAELTGKNPNVLYEIGLAHAIGKPVIIITRNADDVPFDLKALRYLFYDVNEPFWGESLKVGIQNLVRKVLENPSIENYLEGITSSVVKYPKLDLTKKAIATEKKVIDISGTWFGEFHDGSQILHKVTLQLTLDDNEYSGAAVVSFMQEEKQTVVQQILSVMITDDVIALHGVNYTYVEQGASTSYALDNFVLKYDSQQNDLSGNVISIFDDKSTLSAEIAFKKA